MRVSDQSGHSLQFGVAPYIDLIERIAMCANQLVHIFAKGQIANLRTCIFLSYDLTCQHITQTKGPIGCSSTSSKQSMLLRRPRKRFNSCAVVVELIDCLACR